MYPPQDFTVEFSGAVSVADPRSSDSKLFANLVSPFRSPKYYGTLIKKDPKRDPNLDNYPCARTGEVQACDGLIADFRGS